jgi:hypothetical protein
MLTTAGAGRGGVQRESGSVMSGVGGTCAPFPNTGDGGQVPGSHHRQQGRHATSPPRHVRPRRCLHLQLSFPPPMGALPNVSIGRARHTSRAPARRIFVAVTPLNVCNCPPWPLPRRPRDRRWRAPVSRRACWTVPVWWSGGCPHGVRHPARHRTACAAHCAACSTRPVCHCVAFGRQGGALLGAPCASCGPRACTRFQRRWQEEGWWWWWWRRRWWWRWRRWRRRWAWRPGPLPAAGPRHGRRVRRRVAGIPPWALSRWHQHERVETVCVCTGVFMWVHAWVLWRD